MRSTRHTIISRCTTSSRVHPCGGHHARRVGRTSQFCSRRGGRAAAPDAARGRAIARAFIDSAAAFVAKRVCRRIDSRRAFRDEWNAYPFFGSSHPPHHRARHSPTTRSASQAVHLLPTPVHLAQKVGARLGKCALLLRCVPSARTDGSPRCTAHEDCRSGSPAATRPLNSSRRAEFNSAIRAMRAISAISAIRAISSLLRSKSIC